MGEKTKKKKNKRWKIEAANKMLLPLIAVASCSVETPFGSPIRTSQMRNPPDLAISKLRLNGRHKPTRLWLLQSFKDLQWPLIANLYERQA